MLGMFLPGEQVIPRSRVQCALDPYPLGIINDISLSLVGEESGKTTAQQQPTTKFNVLSLADFIAPGFNPAELKLPHFSIEELM